MKCDHCGTTKCDYCRKKIESNPLLLECVEADVAYCFCNNECKEDYKIKKLPDDYWISNKTVRKILTELFGEIWCASETILDLKYVIISANTLKPQFKEDPPEKRVFLCYSGSGLDPRMHGSGLFGFWVAISLHNDMMDKTRREYIERFASKKEIEQALIHAWKDKTLSLCYKFKECSNAIDHKCQVPDGKIPPILGKICYRP